MANVRLIGYGGMVQIPANLLKQYTSEGVMVRQEPPLWRQKIALNGGTAVESAVQANDMAKIVVIEVDDNSAVRYEVNPGGPAASNHRAADTTSPRMVGDNVIQWFAGATVSFVDAASV
jgi:3-hydroxyisobutyrate dehydrogenase-like beta-hydroxyacid dehydrogenase